MLALAGSGCSLRAPRAPIVLISIDTCRADRLGCYGAAAGTTPDLDAFAAEALVFEQAVSPVPITLPAHCSMLTGLYPPRHGVRDNLGYRLAPEIPTLAELLRRHGYPTAAFVSSFVLDSQTGIDRGFQTYDDQLPAAASQGGAESERRGGETSRRARAWLAAHRDESFFLFVHYFDPHTPYDPPPPFAERFAGDPYSGEIAYADDCIGEVLAALKDLDLYERSLIVIAGDHGESLGEHGESAHGYFVYQSSLHVPLLVKPPAGGAAGRCPRRVSLVDIVPTILRQARVKPPEALDGEDLVAIAAGGAEAGTETGVEAGTEAGVEAGGEPSATRRLYCESLTPTKYGAGALVGAVSGDWKYIAGRRPELYDLAADPTERTDRWTPDDRRAAALQAWLREQLTAGGAAEEDRNARVVDAAARERLASLGYVSSRSVDESALLAFGGPDPKDLISFHERFQEILGLMAARDHGQARDLCRTLLAERPEAIDVRILLGDVEFAAGDPAAATAHYAAFLEACDAAADSGSTPGERARDFLRLPANQTRAHYDLANALAAMARTEEAIGHYRDALRLDPGHIAARHNLALTLGRAGRVAEAVVELQELLAREPESVDGHCDLAYALALQGQVADAREHYAQAARLRPGDAALHLRIGDALMEAGDPAGGVEHYVRAQALAPGSSEVDLALARGYLALDEDRRAIAQLERAHELRPDDAAIAGQLAWILATNQDARYRDGAHALELAQAACRRTGNRSARLLDTLAAAYAETGRFEEAVATVRLALAVVSTDTRGQGLARRLQAHLQSFEHRLPIRESL